MLEVACVVSQRKANTNESGLDEEAANEDDDPPDYRRAQEGRDRHVPL
jgi:hypothetical protein